MKCFRIIKKTRDISIFSIVYLPHLPDIDAARKQICVLDGSAQVILSEIRAVLPDDMAKVPAVCREDFWQIVGIFMKRVNEEISDNKAIQELRSVYAPFPKHAYDD
jgi:hypothetical protein